MLRADSSLAVTVLLAAVVPGVQGAVSATILAGSLTQGTVSAPLSGGDYASDGSNLGDWPLTTGSFAGSVFPISVSNANFNGNDFGGTPGTMIAFGNGGGVTLEFDVPVNAVAGQKEFGLFTAQFYDSFSGNAFNGNQEAAILVSADNVTWRTLNGTIVAVPLSYTATSHKLNAPTHAYDYEQSDTAWAYGSGATQASLDALTVADYTVPMPDDNLFNGTGTSGDRFANVSDSSAATYDAIFGSSGGGNWFDISESGLSQIQYVRLNGVNVDSGVRLDGVFANAAAVPEPTIALFGIVTAGAFRRLRRR